MTPLIVVVEDDAQIRRVVEGYLQQDGYRVFTATDGPSALALIQREQPTLIILDIMLPDMDGLEIARRLRASDHPAVAGVYIIMLTARVDETDRVIGLELGADDYVTKPFSPRELVARVRSALRRLDTQQLNADTGSTKSRRFDARSNVPQRYARRYGSRSDRHRVRSVESSDAPSG